MSRARTITREDLIRRYAAAMDIPHGKRPRWQAGQTTTAPAGEVR